MLGLFSRKSLVLNAAWLALALSFWAAEAVGEPSATQTPAPGLNLEESLLQAAGQGRKIAVFCRGDWSPWSLALEQRVLKAPAVQAVVQDLLWVTVDLGLQPEMSERLQVVDVPTFLLLDSKGREIGRIHGYADEAAFLGQLMPLLDSMAPIELPAAQDKEPDAEELFQRLLELRKRGLLKQASATAQLLINADPENRLGRTDNALAFLGLLEGRLGDWETAHSIYDRMAEFYPTTELRPHLLVSLGYSAEKTGRRSEALRAYESFLKEFPKHADIAFVKSELQRIKRLGASGLGG